MKETSIKEVENKKKELAELIGSTIEEIYGVVGLTTVKSFMSQFIILKRDNYVNGVVISETSKNKFDIDIHIIVAYGVKVSEVANEVGKRIFYEANKKFGNFFGKINVFVEDLLVIN